MGPSRLILTSGLRADVESNDHEIVVGRSPQSLEPRSHPYSVRAAFEDWKCPQRRVDRTCMIVPWDVWAAVSPRRRRASSKPC